VKDNVFDENAGTGRGLFSLGGGYVGNSLNLNNGGLIENAQVDGNGTQLGSTLCNFDTTCP
jgi:hypothetical protein